MKLLKIMFFFVLMLFVQPHASACGARTTREVKEFCMTISELISLGVGGLSSGALAQGGVPATKTLHKPAQSQNSEEYEAPPLRDASKASAPVAQIAQAAVVKTPPPQQPPTVVAAKTPASYVQSMSAAGPTHTPVVSSSHPQQSPAAAAAKVPALSAQGACTDVALAPFAALYARTFGQGHTKQQARDVTRFFLPITLKPFYSEWKHVFLYSEDFEEELENDRDQKTGMAFCKQQRHASLEAYITRKGDYEKLYILPNQENIKRVKWDNARDQFVTYRYDEIDYIQEASHRQTRYLWDFAPFKAFTAGIITQEQLILISLLHDVRKKNHVPLSLSDCAALAQEPGITTAELARVLLTFHKKLQDHILSHLEGAPKPSENPAVKQKSTDYRQAYQAFVQARHVVLAQAGDKTALVKRNDAINQALEEYIVDKRSNHKPYVELFVRI